MRNCKKTGVCKETDNDARDIIAWLTRKTRPGATVLSLSG